ncbi:MAG: PAS domain S-box protein [Desulfatibacillum sp.]|nr:PAS domain S-box protein [Desulfatibacillum sp.]
MDVRLLTTVLVIQSICLAIITVMTLEGSSLVLSLVLISIIVLSSLYLRYKHQLLSGKLNKGLQHLVKGDLTLRLIPGDGPKSWQVIAGSFNQLLDALIVARDLEARHLAELESKMQLRSTELLGKTAQLEKTLRLLRKEISHHKSVARELRVSEERFRRLSQSAPIGIFLVNEHGRTTYMNPALKNIFELKSEWDWKPGDKSLPPPDEATSTLEGWLQAILGGEEFSHETQIWTHRRALRWISISAARMLDHDGQFIGYVGTVEDITSLKLTEQALRESELRYREVVENANEAMVVVQGGYPLFWNNKVSELFGYSREEFGTWAFDSHIHPDDRKAVMEKQQLLLEGGKKSSVQSFRLFTRDGNEKWVEQSGVKINWESGPAHLFFLSDITERKSAEEALRQAHDALEREVANRTSELLAANIHLRDEIEERKRGEEALVEHEKLLRATVEATADGILVVDENGRVTHYNGLFRDLFGVPLSLMATRDYERILGYMAVQMEDPIAFNDATFNTRQILQVNFATLELKDGRLIEEYSSPLSKDESNISRVWSFRDITATKELESQLIRSERLAATGQLAASVAHEINSPLQAITMMLGTLKRTYGEDPDLCSQIDLLRGAFLNIRDTVKNLLDLNRPGKEVRQKTNINHIIEMTVGLGNSFFKKNRVIVTLNLDRELPEIMASPQQMSQVVLNLVNNAVEAISSVHGEEETGPKGSIIVKTYKAGEHLAMQVRDTGPGISNEDLNNVFDPFYTRKKKMGMGVGLSICLGIVEEHKGSITAENDPDGGAVFTITLPIKGGSVNRHRILIPGNRKGG